MTMSFLLRARLEFPNAEAIDAARQALVSEGYTGHADNTLEHTDLKWRGLTLTVELSGSMPYSCFDISSGVLATYALHAASGEALAVNTEDGVGERFLAGGESEDLEDDEVDALRPRA